MPDVLSVMVGILQLPEYIGPHRTSRHAGTILLNLHIHHVVVMPALYLNKVIQSVEYIYKSGWVQRNEIYHILQDLETIKGDLITADIMKISQQLKWSEKKESK